MLTIDTIQNSHYIVDDQEVIVRPMSHEDEKLEEDFYNNLSPTSKYFRFMEGMSKLSPAMLKQLCDTDGKHTMAFIATIKTPEGERQIGVSRYACGIHEGDSETESEMALTVADDWQHKDIDSLLMKPLIEYAKNNGIQKLYTFEFAENAAMRKIAKQLGMTGKVDPEDTQFITYSLKI